MQVENAIETIVKTQKINRISPRCAKSRKIPSGTNPNLISSTLEAVKAENNGISNATEKASINADKAAKQVSLKKAMRSAFEKIDINLSIFDDIFTFNFIEKYL
jgi:hypothetical protein